MREHIVRKQPRGDSKRVKLRKISLCIARKQMWQDLYQPVVPKGKKMITTYWCAKEVWKATKPDENFTKGNHNRKLQ